jgi:hypothetical protein
MKTLISTFFVLSFYFSTQQVFVLKMLANKKNKLYKL